MSLRNRFLLGITVIVVLAGVALSLRIESILKKSLIDALPYDLEIGRLTLRPLFRGFRLDDITLSSDSLRLTVIRIDVRGIRIMEWIRNRNLEIGIITIDSSNLDLIPKKTVSDSDSIPLIRRIFDIVKPYMESAKVNEFTVRNAMAAVRTSFEMSPFFQTKGISLTLNDVILDSTLTPISRIEFSADSSRWALDSGLYELSSGKISLSSLEKNFRITSLNVTPLGSFEAFPMRHGKINRIGLSARTIELKGFEVDSLLIEGKIIASELAIDHTNFRLSHDKRVIIPHPPRKKLLHMMVNDVPVPFTVDKVTVANSSITYRHRHVDNPVPAILKFSALNATLNHVSNIDKNEMRLQAKTTVMDEGKLQVGVVFNMRDPLGSHRLTGSIVETKFEAFNPVLENMVFIRAKSGKLHRMDFDMTLNDVSSSGFLTMDYEDFSIQVLGDGQRFKSFVANRFILDRNRHGMNVKSVPLSFKRLREKSIFNYWWMSMLDGISKSIGLK